MCDKLVFDLSQEVEGSPNVFIRKDWINILDNQNQNYSNNQSIIDTSQLSNSNKYMSYRESYLAVPMVLTMGTPISSNNASYAAGAGSTLPVAGVLNFSDFGAAGGGDYVMGLKNWFGTVIHSMTLDYNGTTVCQQTPYINMWNSFKLMTSLSYQDIISQGDQIGFHFDDSTSFSYYPTAVGTAIDAVPAGGDFIVNGGCCNNSNYMASCVVTGLDNNFSAGQGNLGFLNRQQLINFDGAALVGSNSFISKPANTFGPYINTSEFATGLTTTTYTGLLASNALNLLWKSYVYKRTSGIASTTAANVITITTAPILQIAIMATIKLKHIHSFFNMCPLLKGVFMKLTLNLNNTTTTIVNTYSVSLATLAAGPLYSGMYVASVANAVGGVNPLMISSPALYNGGSTAFGNIDNAGGVFNIAGAGGTLKYTTYANLAVGSRCLDSGLASISGCTAASLAQSIYLYTPAYTFNPTFEQAYLSSPVKQIKYTDVYQYQITSIASAGMINNLITNGIANIKSVLVIPYYSSTFTNTTNTNVKSNIAFNTNTNLPQGMPVFQSPFDPAGSGCTSPLCHISNFNVQISGQNAIYNLQKYNYEQFNNQLYGQNSVNGGLTDGLTSGLVGRQDFDMEYCYYYVNVERMLPVEESVPKSVQIIGQNLSGKACDYWVFVEYGVSISIDALTGSRV